MMIKTANGYNNRSTINWTSRQKYIPSVSNQTSDIEVSSVGTHIFDTQPSLDLSYPIPKDGLKRHMQPPSLYLFFLHLYISISTSCLSLTVYFHLYVLYISFLISWSASVFLYMCFWKSPSVHLFLYIASIYPIQYISNFLSVYPSEYIFLYISVCMCLSEYLKCVQYISLYISICYLHV